jgi:chromosome segregation protein
LNFRKLQVTGFKSFADKIELVFEPGTTAVVGPNGCGKSNICDAIKWALGEQNARTLRCDKMESIIFNGGSNRHPLGMAEVSLVISNSQKLLPTDYTEVEISRRLFRSGESEYYINRNKSLLKDIQELFMDTGLGLNSYSIMEQGHIDMILNSSPQERRLILEEAAGITKFRHRKKTSLKKLEATEQNLVRVNDILYELERQVSSLKRQASKARRYQKYHQELKNLDTELSLRKYHILIAGSKDIQKQLTGLDDKMRSHSGDITKLEADLESHRLKIAESQGKLSDIRMNERKIQARVEETESEIAVLRERRSNLQKQQQRAIQEVSRLEKQLQELEKQLGSINIERGKLGESISGQEKELKLAQEDADKLTQATASAEKNLEKLKTQAIDIINRKSKAQNELSATDSRLDYLVTRLERLNNNADNFRSEYNQLEGKLGELQQELKAKEDEIKDMEAEQKRVDAEIWKLQSKAATLEKSVREIERNKSAKASRLQSLKELQEAYEGYNAGVKAILGGHKKSHKNSSLEGVRGVLAEIVRAEARYELAVEASLGSSVQGVVTETIDNARAAVEYLKERKSGRATLFPLDAFDGKETVAEFSESLPDGVLAIASKIVDFEGEYSNLVEYLLGDTFIVENLNVAISLAMEFLGRSENSVRFATLDGQMVSSSGIITGGAGSEGAGLLRRSREINDLVKEVSELDAQLADITKKRDIINSEISSLHSEKGKNSSELHKKQISYTGMQKDLSQYKQRLKRLEDEIGVVAAESDSLEKDIISLEDNKSRLKTDAEKLEKQSREIDKQIGVLQSEMKTQIQQRDAVIQRCTNIKVQLASKKQQERGLAEKQGSLGQEKGKILRSLSSYQTSASSDGETEKEIAGKIEAKEKLLERAFRERTKTEEEISKLETQRQNAELALSQGEASIRENRRAVDQINQEKYQLEVKKTQLNMNMETLISKMRERYGISISGIEDAQESEDDWTEDAEEELKIRIDELRERMEKMGSVNLTAVDEYERQKERYDLLIAQKEDLEKAKDSLYNIIHRINRESRERLRETFESVNKSFQDLFKRLFGGGHAELVMIGDEDVLESGIDIAARPPGKKPQSISMLSSGERSLTAIAILFALFRIKPSPLCVLDEVDAALDDANVGRFTDMVKEFSQNTQFVIITHNKRTMEMADVLYGVTMEESGVSKVVSLRMKEDGEVSRIAS